MTKKPDGWGLFVAYCISLDLVYGLLVIGGVALAMFSGSAEPHEQQELLFTGLFMSVFTLPFFLATLVAPFLPQKKWVYMYHLIMIAIGISSCLWWPIVIPLLIKWVKPETKQWYEQDYEDVFS